jgi:bifunctional DNase/RNase
MAIEVAIIGVSACECPSHARVVLRDEAGRRNMQVRIHADAGQAMLAEIAGLASTRSAMVDLLGELLARAEVCADRLTLCCSRGRLCAKLSVRGPGSAEDGDLVVEPCEALLAAYRLRLPVFVEEEAPEEDSGVPDVYRELVESLDLSGFGCEGERG